MKGDTGGPSVEQLRARAVEARLLEDRDGLLEVALDPGCPPDLLARLAEGDDLQVRLAVLTHPRCPVAVLRAQARAGHRLQTAAALHPAAPPELLEALARRGKVSVSTAVVLHPAASTRARRQAASCSPALGSALAALELGLSGWCELARHFPPRPAEPWSAESGIAREPDVPLALVAGQPRLVRAYLLENPAATERAAALLARCRDLSWAEPDVLEALVEHPALARRTVEAVLERALSLVQATIRGQALPGHAARAGLLERAALHRAWAGASPGELAEWARRHPRVYTGFLGNPHLADEARRALREEARRQPGFVAGWSGPLDGPRHRGGAGERRPRRGASPFERLPLRLAVAVASRPDLSAEQVRTLERRCAQVRAALAGGPLLGPAALAVCAGRRQPAVDLALAGNPRTPRSVLRRLVNTLPDQGLSRLAANPALEPELLARLAARLAAAPVRAWPGDADRAWPILAAHPRLPLELAETIAARKGRDGHSLLALVRRADLPLARRRAWIQGEREAALYELTMPEADPARIAHELDLLERGAAAAPLQRRHAALLHLLRNPALDGAALERILAAGLAAVGEWPAAPYVDPDRWGQLVRHPAASEALFRQLLAHAEATPDPDLLRALAREARVSGGLLERIAAIAWREELSFLTDVAAHPAAPLAVLRRCLAVTSGDGGVTDAVQAAAAANPRVPLDEVLTLGRPAEREDDRARAARMVAWVELGPRRAEVLELLAHHGRPAAFPGAEERARLLAPERLREVWPEEWLEDVLAEPGWDPPLYDLTARRACASRSLLARGAEVVARHASDPELLRWLAQSLASRPGAEARALLLLNPATPSDVAEGLLVALEAGAAGQGLSRARRRDLARVRPELVERLDESAGRPGRPDEATLLAMARAFLEQVAPRKRRPWFGEGPEASRFHLAGAITAREEHVARLALLHTIITPGEARIGRRTVELIARQHGVRPLIWALCAFPGRRRVVLTAASRHCRAGGEAPRADAERGA